MQDWILDIVRTLGEFGIGLLMLAESVVFPIPSEYVMPLAGYLSAQGAMNFWGALLAGTIGSILGALGWYYAGFGISERRMRALVHRYGIWLALQEDDVDLAMQFFKRHGKMGVFLGRLIPVVRVLISIPAGMARMPLRTFLWYSGLGSLLWNLLLATLGRGLGRYLPQIQDYLGMITWAVVLGAVVVYAMRVARLVKRRKLRHR